MDPESVKNLSTTSTWYVKCHFGRCFKQMLTSTLPGSQKASQWDKPIVSGGHPFSLGPGWYPFASRYCSPCFKLGSNVLVARLRSTASRKRFAATWCFPGKSQHWTKLFCSIFDCWWVKCQRTWTLIASSNKWVNRIIWSSERKLRRTSSHLQLNEHGRDWRFFSICGVTALSSSYLIIRIARCWAPHIRKHSVLSLSLISKASPHFLLVARVFGTEMHHRRNWKTLRLCRYSRIRMWLAQPSFLFFNLIQVCWYLWQMKRPNSATSKVPLWSLREDSLIFLRYRMDKMVKSPHS